ncbi:SCO2525 family SAM-dependent methyltransferase [Pseudofrankia inefficax]|uniref:Methyltransferase NNMT/PNMT/TEMT n=1 Tax=Pseudofrankia inefficax (strain DSM 45817 / CECT 9037 / DDB 130130 / EuI1c) TaxID=298654 RepID=E3IWE7_PSEI1|nr:SCO2525 family SAM-dependent methyltransferase [Pseudofrankia inefficax]ADP80130.1 Methyltransferase NNMT/PNMT/TEMT [Pseudofrankia inefficax]
MSTTARSSSNGPARPAERTSGALPEQERRHSERAGDLLGNADFQWDRFDPTAYVDHNYKTLRADDQQILERVRDHFATHFAARGEDPRDSGLVGADLGAGPNLYPALAMLPWVDHLELVEYSPSNCEWLRGEVKEFGRSWDPFWELLTRRPAYAAVADPRAELARVTSVVQGSLFDRRHERWDLATMFFVAESISSRRQEFAAAVDGFVDALRPGAPFAAAFMERSTGYEVGTEHFPAVPVSLEDVRTRLSARTEVVVERIALADNPLREGYTGMIVALGTKTAR